MARPILSKQSSYEGQHAESNFNAGFPQYPSVSRQGSYLPQYASHRAARRPLRVFRHDFFYPIFAGDWGYNDYVAVASFNEDPNNLIHILRAQHQRPGQPPGTSGQTPQLTSYNFESVSEVSVTMPQTKLMWNPTGEPQLLSSGDALRVWQFDLENSELSQLTQLVKQSKSQPTAVPAPMTSFDWNRVSPNLAIVSSIDTTCTVWDLNTQTVTTQLIAHDQEVFDVAFLPQSQHQFVSVGFDGSARLFDLRSLDNSTIIYESQPSTPMLRIAPAPYDENVVAAFGQDKNSVVILDIRATRNPVAVLEAHQAPVNSIRWIPKSASLLATGADDCQVLMWDTARGTIAGSYSEIQQVNHVLASPDGNWLGSLNGKSLQAISTHIL